jgi:hypothetical protein
MSISVFFAAKPDNQKMFCGNQHKLKDLKTGKPLITLQTQTN